MADVNIFSVESGDVTNAGMFLFYSMLSSIANLIGLIILVVVLTLLFAKMGLGGLLKFK